jgi:hypothetical protein
MALSLSTLVKPVNDQVIDPSTGVMRDAWVKYFKQLTQYTNSAVGALSTDPAPANAGYIVDAASAGLSAERVLSDSASILRNVAGAGLSLERAALTGDVTASQNSNATTIANDAVTFAKLLNAASAGFIGATAAGDYEHRTPAQVTAALDVFTSLLKGLVPASGGGTSTFLRADGTFATAGALALLTSGSVSAQAALGIPLTAYTAYRGIIIELINFIPATDDVDFRCRLSSNGGSSYDSGASDYRYANSTVFSSNVVQNQGSGGAAFIQLCGGSAGTAHIGNGAAEGLSCQVTITGQASAAAKTKVRAFGEYYGAGDFSSIFKGGGHRNTAQDTDAIQFFFSSGNITSGSYAVYGLA